MYCKYMTVIGRFRMYSYPCLQGKIINVCLLLSPQLWSVNN